MSPVPAWLTVKEYGPPAPREGGSLTTSVKDCVAGGFTPLLAVIVNVYGPPLSCGVPEIVPSDASETPNGMVPPVNENAGAGMPEAVAVNVPFTPSWNVVVAALVNCGAHWKVALPLAFWLGIGKEDGLTVDVPTPATLHCTNVQPALGWAVRVTVVKAVMFDEVQVAPPVPQLMPPGLLVA
jgi:hypothetical protein